MSLTLDKANGSNQLSGELASRLPEGNFAPASPGALDRSAVAGLRHFFELLDLWDSQSSQPSENPSARPHASSRGLTYYGS